jgi:hypothetical protein
MASKPKKIDVDAPENTSWFNTSWRPAMAWQWLVVCLFDFMIAPILLGIYSYYTGTYQQWDPLTIRGGGLYHVAMGAVVGVSVWGRSAEKIKFMNDTPSATEEGPLDEVHRFRRRGPDDDQNENNYNGRRD